MSPYSPYHYTQPKTTNWPKIILIALGILVLIGIIVYLITNPGLFGKRGDNNSGGITYDCSSDVYNCGNFTTQAEAQLVFDYCEPTAGDIHGLDADGNGRACEGLA